MVKEIKEVIVNDNLVLICGYSSGGKSASLRALKDPKGVMYLNCEAGKKLPFPAKFDVRVISHPSQIFAYFVEAESMDHIHTIVVDSITFMMDMFETMIICTSDDTQAAWGKFNQFFKKFMQKYVAESSKNVICTAHILETLNKKTMAMETKVPVKGALKNNGIEAYFSTVIYAKKVTVDSLDSYENDLLVISPQEKALGIKYVFQTQLTQETVDERIRSNMAMWEQQETFIDNDAQLLLNRLHTYYDV